MDKTIKIIVIIVLFVIVAFRLWMRKKAGSAQGVSAQRPSPEGGSPQEGPKRTSPEDFIASIPGLAEDHVKRCRDIFNEELDYSEESMKRIDAIINKGWPNGPPVMLEPTAVAFGAYVGEAIKRNLGGNWGYSEEEGYFLENVGGKAKVFPFAKVVKRFKEGEGDSIGFYYAATKHIIEKEEQ